MTAWIIGIGFLSILSLIGFWLWQARRDGRREAENEALSNVVSVQKDQLKAEANKPRNMRELVDKLQSGDF